MKRLKLVLKSLFYKKDVCCGICKDSGEIEVLVMGTDTDFIECPYCIDM